VVGGCCLKVKYYRLGPKQMNNPPPSHTHTSVASSSLVWLTPRESRVSRLEGSVLRALQRVYVHAYVRVGMVIVGGAEGLLHCAVSR
jgi:hypothetical protein